MTGPACNVQFCFPSALMFPLANLKGLEGTKLTVSLWAVITGQVNQNLDFFSPAIFERRNVKQNV